MKRFTKTELVSMNARLENEAMGLRILTTCLLHGTQPFAVRNVEFYSDESQGFQQEYREQWSHYRPDSACGGVILIEQFELESGRKVAHRTVIGCGEEFTALVNGEGGAGRRDLARSFFKNQFDAVA